MSPIDKIEANANPRVTISTNLTHTHDMNGIRMSSPCGGSWALGVHSTYKAEAA